MKRDLYERLKRSIISGELVPGVIINEQEIATRFGVSRTPVREALLILAHEGLVKALPRTGYIVTEFPVREVVDIFYVRELLEVEAAGMAAGRVKDEEVEALKQIHYGILGSEDRLSGNREFHMAVADASGNARLAKMIGDFLDDVERILARDPLIVSDEHNPLIDALANHDRDGAREAMRSHIRQVQERVLGRA